MEAILSAVLIATGLVLISRALNSQLAAIHAVEEYDALLPLARLKLAAWEAERLFSTTPPAGSREGVFDSVGGSAMRWRVTAARRADLDALDGQPLFSDIRLWVGPDGQGAGRSLVLTAIWPSSWVPEEWYS